MKPILVTLCLCLFSAWTYGEGKSIELPIETDTYRPGPNVELVKAQCLICHSVEYTASQPPMDGTFWKGIVVKMKEKFGAPIPDDSIAPLTEYLTAVYGKKN